MKIDLNTVNVQANQLRAKANSLRDERIALQSYRQNLNNDWRGQEMIGVNNFIDNTMSQLLSLSSELDNIASDVISAGQEVRRQEELAEAMAALGRADANIANLRVAFDNAQRHHYENPSSSTHSALISAQNKLNDEINVRNNVAVTVRSLQP